MRPVRWTEHAGKSLVDREIDRGEVERALLSADTAIPGKGGRQVLLRRFDDPALGRPMLLCVVVEDREDERVVLTVYKTSKIEKYLERGAR